MRVLNVASHFFSKQENNSKGVKMTPPKLFLTINWSFRAIKMKGHDCPTSKMTTKTVQWSIMNKSFDINWMTQSLIIYTLVVTEDKTNAV